MILTGVLFSLFYAIILTVIFAVLFKKDPWNSFWKFFLILFLVGAVSQFWLRPAGPVAWNYYWLPGLLSAVIVALLLVAVYPLGKSIHVKKNKSKEEGTPPELTAASYHSPHSPEGRQADASERNAGTSIFFWALIILLSLLFIAGLFIEW